MFGKWSNKSQGNEPEAFELKPSTPEELAWEPNITMHNFVIRDGTDCLMKIRFGFEHLREKGDDDVIRLSKDRGPTHCIDSATFGHFNVCNSYDPKSQDNEFVRHTYDLSRLADIEGMQHSLRWLLGRIYNGESFYENNDGITLAVLISTVLGTQQSLNTVAATLKQRHGEPPMDEATDRILEHLHELFQTMPIEPPIIT